MSYRRLSFILQPKTGVLGLLLLLSAALSVTAVRADGAVVAPPRETPPPMTSVIADETGAELRMSDLQGHAVLVNFWATWCAPCVAELPALSRAAAALAKDDIVVMLVSIDRGGAPKAMPFLERLDVTGVRLGFDPKARLSRETGVRGLPTTLLMTPSQDGAWRFVGPFEWDSDAMLRLVRDLARH